MIHYHGTPVGGPEDQAGRFLRGRHAMVSFANPSNLGVALEVCQSVVLDNGAFTLWRKGGDVDVPKYRAWVNALAGHPSLDWCLIPDKIDGNEQDNRALVDAWSCEVESVPVWHMHESLGFLDYLICHFRTVALGSSGQWPTPGTDSWWRRMGEAMAVACDAAGRPRARLHGLRMLAPEVFTRLPLASADSTNAVKNGSASASRFGSYPPPTAAQGAEVIAARIEAHNSAPCWVSAGEQRSLIA